MAIDMWQCGEYCYLECDDYFSESFSGYLNPDNFLDFFQDLKDHKMPVGTYYRAIYHRGSTFKDYTYFPNGLRLVQENKAT